MPNCRDAAVAFTEDHRRASGNARPLTVAATMVDANASPTPVRSSGGSASR